MIVSVTGLSRGVIIKSDVTMCHTTSRLTGATDFSNACLVFLLLFSSLGIRVDISGCGFVKIPTITTSLEGRANLYYTIGATSPYDATTSGFYVYILHSDYTTGTYLRDTARQNNWNIELVAVGYTC